MDWWVVATITGAGYAAKYLQNFSRDRDGLSGLMSRSSTIKKPDSPLLTTHVDEKTSSLQKSIHRRSDQHLFSDRGNRNLLSHGRLGESTPCNSPSSEEIASTSGFEGEFCDSFGEIYGTSAHHMGTFHGPRKGRKSLRRKLTHLQSLTPLNSLDSCLMAQLYKERAEMVERVLAPLPSPCDMALRPFVVTDGTRVISQQSFDSFSVQSRKEKEKVHMKAHPETDEVVLGGIPWLPERGSEGSREKNLKKAKDQIEKLSSTREMPSEMQISSQGSPGGALLFCFGVSIGMMSSTLANKMEVTKLKDVLKQTENLVQDLQEELDMKDSLTVKELVSEDNIFPHEHESSIDIHQATETVESMNQIEAELEAELERLGLNTKGSTLHAKFSDDDELISYTKQGVVSPRELSLRLHQVIESRLEERIIELEVALEKSQKRLQHLESGQRLGCCSWRRFSNNRASSSSSSSSGQGSPVAVEAVESQTRTLEEEAEGELPLVMNLSGKALDAYNEAFEELNNINGSENTVEEWEKFSLDEDCDDDDTTLLIKQIVEKARQGSPAVLHAHRAMASMDRND